eukprot:CAMPEP_0183407332 /NCGR_PEP_ID=MMETSP0370-20130417/17285_1 /TAXON_ID=268820 /ORGANISM="Peridinium aciculiferum, Strain PAER-2" /LENGTH=185 /DNA_ID=CAMNT_0025589689 /DNA_START=213 /DNA_END=770 /DNA_ORIENTATION=-
MTTIERTSLHRQTRTLTGTAEGTLTSTAEGTLVPLDGCRAFTAEVPAPADTTLMGTCMGTLTGGPSSTWAILDGFAPMTNAISAPACASWAGTFNTLAPDEASNAQDVEDVQTPSRAVFWTIFTTLRCCRLAPFPTLVSTTLTAFAGGGPLPSTTFTADERPKDKVGITLVAFSVPPPRKNCDIK